MNWKEKDKRVRNVLARRLFILREKSDEARRKLEQKCKLKEAKEILSLIKAIDDCLDLIRFINYGYADFKIRDYEIIEEKQRGMFEVLEEIEKNLNIDEKNPDFIFNVRNAKAMIHNLMNTQEEIKSLIMAFIPSKKEIREDVL